MISNRFTMKCFLAVFLIFGLASFAGAEVIQVDSNFDGNLDQWHHKSEDVKLMKVEYYKNGD